MKIKMKMKGMIRLIIFIKISFNYFISNSFYHQFFLKFFIRFRIYLFHFSFIFSLRYQIKKELELKEDSEKRTFEMIHGKNIIESAMSKIHKRNLKYKEEKEKRKTSLQTYLQKFFDSNIKLKKNKTELKEKIKISVMKRLEERSIFLESRMKISEECKFVISKLMESFLLSQKHGFEISDITFRRKNLTEEVQLFFSVSFILIFYSSNT